MRSAFSFPILLLVGCVSIDPRVSPVPTSVIPGPVPMGETWTNPVREVEILALPDGSMQPQTFVLLTNRPPPPMVGTAIKFMPFTNSSPIRYTLKYRTNLLDTNWVEFTNAILDGPPHWFYFYVMDDTNFPQRYFTIDPSHL